MKNIYILLFLLLVTELIAQGRYFKEYDAIPPKSKREILIEKHTVYKIQILSSNVRDGDKFKYFTDDYVCEIVRSKSKLSGDVYRYLITPKENTLHSSNLLLDELFYYYQNPFIVIYWKGKRQN